MDAVNQRIIGCLPAALLLCEGSLTSILKTVNDSAMIACGHVKMLFVLAILFVGYVTCQSTCPDPGSVTELEVWNITSRTMSVRWSAPASTALECVSSYRVCWAAVDDGFPEQCSSHPASVTQVTLEGLAVCANYTIEVTTVGPAVSSAPAVLSVFSGPGPIGSASTLTVNITTLSVLWGYDVFTNGPCITHFEVLVCDEEDQALETCRNYTAPPQATPEVVVSGLATCRQYHVSLFAVDGRSVHSDRSQLPGYVDGLAVASNISLRDTGSTSVEVSWSLPQVDAVCFHEPIVCHVRDGGEARVCESFATESLASFTLTDLWPCTTYSVQVIIITPGDSFVASPVQHHTRSHNGTMLLEVEASEVSDTSITVTWQTLYPSPPCVWAYSVCLGQGDTEMNCTNAEASTTSLRLSGLQPETTYTVAVTALFRDSSNSDTVTMSATTAAATTATPGSSNAQAGSWCTMGLLLSLALFFRSPA